MNDIALPARRGARWGETPPPDLIGLHRHLQRNIVSARGYVQPIELLAERIVKG